MAMKIKKDDQVKVISGKAKGSEGKVMRVIPEKSTVIIEGLNKAKKHQKPNQKDQKGGIVEKEMPIHVSNVALISPKSGKPTKVSRRDVDGKRVRVERKTGNPIDG
jgi:large subunit ribosomal protein L24